MQFQACAFCDHPNPVGTNYCNDCGATLRLKPCQECGTVAGAMAQACPGCSASFPDRPIIEVDIAWARPPGAVDHRPPRPRSPTPPMSDARRLATVTRALAETREVIEKASVGACSVAALSWAGKDDGAARPAPRGDRSDRPTPGAIQVKPIAAAPPASSSEPRQRPASQAEPGWDAFARFGPMVFITLLGLIAAVALLHLVRFAGESASSGSSASAAPYKTLLRSSPQVLEATAVAAPADPSDRRSKLYELPPAATFLEQPSHLAGEAMAEPAMVVPVNSTPGAIASARAEAPLAPAKPSTPLTQGLDQCRPELRALNLCGKVN